ncbi:MAG: CvpA family protein [Acidobacteria bacterium]|nr:CvpA family protein [Acidobacteriota bacterium]
MNILDIIFLVILVLSFVLALFKGLVKEIISLVALVGGLLLAATGYDTAATLFGNWIDSAAWRDVLGFLLIFLGIQLAAGMTVFVIDRILKFSHIKWFDRLAGGVFGILRGWLICSVILLAMTAFSLELPVVQQSALSPYLMITARLAAGLVPDELHREFEKQYRLVYDQWLDVMDKLPPAATDAESVPGK